MEGDTNSYYYTFEIGVLISDILDEQVKIA